MSKGSGGIILGLVLIGLSVGGLVYAYSKRKEDDISGSDPDAPIMPDNGDVNDTGGPSPGDIEGMARALESEAPARRYTPEERIGIAWCAINWSNRTRQRIAAIMLPPHHQKGHWCSTIESPTEGSLTLAQDVFNGKYADPTSGATSFFEPAVQDTAAKTGAAGVTRTAEEIRSKWKSEGLILTTIIGRWEFYKKG